MKKRFISVIIAAILVTGFAFAEQSEFTGSDYLKLSKRQRIDLVSDFIKDAKRSGVTIRQSPVFYCRRLDAFYTKQQHLKKEAFVMVLKTLIIMEYDWQQKGVDKEKLAREWLGDESYQANKRRLKGI